MTIGVKCLVAADVSASAGTPLCGSISSNTGNNCSFSHHHPFRLPHHADATPAAPPTRRDADEFQPRPPRHDDNGAAVFGAEDGADGAVGVCFEEVDAG